jgi:hypothetical protein
MIHWNFILKLFVHYLEDIKEIMLGRLKENKDMERLPQSVSFNLFICGSITPVTSCDIQ